MTTADREVLTRIARSSAAAHREVVRARVLLAAADGVGTRTIARDHGISPITVRAWRKAFTAEGLTGWGKVKKGRGRKPSIPDATIAEIVRLTTTTKPKGATHWSTRSLGRKLGISHSTVHRVWSELGLKPHLVDTFKLFNDPAFEEKVTDVVGLYLAPPENGVVLCVDELGRAEAR